MKQFFQLYFLVFSFFINAQDLQTNLQNIFTNRQLMGMSVCVFTADNQSVYNFGYKNLSQNLLVDTDTKYRVASISKSFTAFGLMKLYDQNLFELDDAVATYLGYSVFNPYYPTIPITFRMLLSHTSSLQDGSGYNNFLNATYSQNPIPNMSSVLTPSGAYFTTNMWRNEQPGTYFNYSNINYGLIGTLIEKISNQRFDVFMKNEILIPLGITGSYNIADIDQLTKVATLYRKVAGSWLPQFDNYNGITPTPPNLTNYIIGTNGAYFSPQGGLRATVSELALFLKFIKTNGNSVPGLLNSNTIETMKTVHWTDNGFNGDNYYGLFNKWGLGLHFANTNVADFVCDQSSYGNFVGHTGEAYGLISDAFYSLTTGAGFVFITNGSFNGYVTNTNSFYTIENEVFSSLCAYFNQTLPTTNIEQEVTTLYPNPTTSEINLNLKEVPTKIEIIDNVGKVVFSKSNIKAKNHVIDMNDFKAGIYILKVNDHESNSSFKKIIKK